MGLQVPTTRPSWFFVFLVEMGIHQVGQAGLELLTSGITSISNTSAQKSSLRLLLSDTTAIITTITSCYLLRAYYVPGQALYSLYPHHSEKQASSAPFYRQENWDSDWSTQIHTANKAWVLGIQTRSSWVKYPRPLNTTFCQRMGVTLHLFSFCLNSLCFSCLRQNYSVQLQEKSCWEFDCCCNKCAN